MKYIPTLILFFCCSLISNSLWSQQFGKGERGERLKALWVAYVTQELDLSAEESEKFWPIYNQMKNKEQALNKQKRRIGKKTTQSLSEAEIDQIFEKIMSVEEQLILLKRESYRSMKTAIPAQKIVQLPKLERAFKKKILKLVQERRGQKGERQGRPGGRPGGGGRRRGGF